MALCIHSKLLAVVEQYLLATGTAPATFGLAAANAPGFVYELRKGRRLRQATAERMLAYMDSRLEMMLANMGGRMVYEAEGGE